ncbi:MAG: lysylphosphatidylglycerol synthase transmembrane domain-containing protein [Afipia sp.]|nr:lysylphosphatidylglycerol synthase transmembrane domain-containing protein [Afipia sp.]
MKDATAIDQTVRKSRDWRRLLPWLGAAIGLTTLAWVLRKFDLDRFLIILKGADLRFLALLPAVVIAEQLIRAWKWRQLLFPLRAIGTIYLFGAIMAGYLLAAIVPFGFGTIARSWLVARRESLKLTSVLATVALDRLSDGIVFVCLIPIVLLLVTFSDPGGIRAGLIWGGAGMLLLFVVLIGGLAIYRQKASTPGLARLLDRLPARLAAPLKRLSSSFAEGINWPVGWRAGAVVIGSIAIKLLAVTQFLWAGLAFGIALEPAQYLFIMVFVGSLVILGHFARVAGSFIIGALFVLALLGVPEEQALAMVLVVEAANLLSVTGIGALALWSQGIAISAVRAEAAARGR